MTTRAPDGTVLLDDVSFSVPRGSLVAVVGPTGAGKTTLLNALTGMASVDAGRIVRNGAMGYVPQHDALHSQLDLRRTLEYSANLRLPASFGPQQRAARIDAVLAQLGLERQAHLPIGSLSGGQRKRAAVAVELIADPDVIVLDEPTAGLDPGYEKSLLQTLRALADSGRTVIAVTHSLQALSLCDLALFIAPGGRVAFYGRPAQAMRYFGSRDAADVFLVLDREKGTGWADRFRKHPAYRRYTKPAPAAPKLRQAEPTTNHFGALTRRYLDLIRADKRQLAMLLLQGPVLGLLLWSVLTPGALRHPATPDAMTVAVFIVISAAWLGTANSVREIVKERQITQRERGGGLSVAAYLGSKVAVLGTLTMVQSAVMAAIALSRQHASPHASMEMIVAAGAVGAAAVSLGLLFSAVVESPDKALSLLPVVLVAQLVLSGGWASVLRTPGLHQVADLTVSRWGVQAFVASGRADGHAWWASMAALAGLGVTCILGAWLLVFIRTAPRTDAPRRWARAAAMIPVSALLCSAAVLALGADHPASMAGHAAPPTVAAPARAPRQSAAPASPRASTPTTAAPSSAATKPATASRARLATAAAEPPAASITVIPPVSVPLVPITTPAVTLAPVTAAPAVGTPATTTPPTTAAPAPQANPWAQLASSAIQWWMASHTSAPTQTAGASATP